MGTADRSPRCALAAPAGRHASPGAHGAICSVSIAMDNTEITAEVAKLTELAARHVPTGSREEIAEALVHFASLVPRADDDHLLRLAAILPVLARHTCDHLSDAPAVFREPPYTHDCVDDDRWEAALVAAVRDRAEVITRRHPVAGRKEIATTLLRCARAALLAGDDEQLLIVAANLLATGRHICRLLED